MQAGLSTKNAPSPKVVLPHFAFGALSFFIASVMLFFVADDLISHYSVTRLLSVTHVLVLGWITTIIFGSLYQLIPVVMEVKLYSEKIALIGFVLFSIGLGLLSASFWTYNYSNSWGMNVGGSMVLLSVILFAFNAIKSAAKTERKTIENVFVVTAVLWLVFTVIIGFVIVLNFIFYFLSVSHLQLLKMHAHLGLVGWFLLLVIGVASKLMPMFLIVHKLPRKLLNYAYFLINAGMILMLFGFWFQVGEWLLVLAGVLVVTGIVLFLRFNQVAFSKRLRKKLDVGMKMSAMAFIFLAVTILAGMVSLFNPDVFGPITNRMNVVYGITVILGFLSSMVLGQTYKTLPFIVWLKIYHSKVGTTKVPLPHELYNDKLARGHFYTYLLGMLLLIPGVLTGSVLLIQIAAVLIIATAVLYNLNVFKILFHKEKKQ